MREMTLETFYIINQIISLETLERSFHHEEKTEISREAPWDI